jgi:FtsH-binding integral membrane protein
MFGPCFDEEQVRRRRTLSMSITLILFIVSVVCWLVATVLHIVMLVHGFKTSTKWGLICLLVPFGSLVFAFKRFGGGGRRIAAFVFLAAMVAGGICAGVASYQTAQAAVGSAEAAAVGMKEAELQIQDIENMEDLQLDL